MFENYTEKARRVIFFARYEASQLGSRYIEPEHLLLGVLREDKALTNRVVRGFEVQDSIRKEIVDHTYTAETVSTSVDLPMSKRSKSVLALAEKERIRTSSARLETQHLLLGILQEQGLGAELLQARGITLETARDALHEPSTTEFSGQPKPVTACRDCRHLVIDGEPDDLRLHLFCAASPREPEFDCYTGEFRTVSGRPPDKYKPCVMVNFGNCGLFESKEE